MEFRVKALDREQAVTAQHVDAIDETDARRQLGLLGLRVISLTPVRQARLFTRPGKIPLVIFSQELVSLLDAGLSLVESMEALTEKEESAAVRRPLEQILSRLYEGQTLVRRSPSIHRRFLICSSPRCAPASAPDRCAK